MPQFDVHTIGNQGQIVVNIQHRMMDSYHTRVVIPLVRAGIKTIDRFTPCVTIQGNDYIFQTAQLSAVRVQDLGPVIENLADQRLLIIEAVDYLLSGI